MRAQKKSDAGSSPWVCQTDRAACKPSGCAFPAKLYTVGQCVCDAGDINTQLHNDEQQTVASVVQWLAYVAANNSEC